MSTIQNDNITKVLSGVMLSMTIGLGAWNLKATHQNAQELAIVRQMVVDGKEARLDYQMENSDAHKRIEVKLSIYDGKFIEMTELKTKITALELNLKSIEAQLVELRIGGKATEVQFVELRTSIKSIETQLAELKLKITSLEDSIKKVVK